MAGTRASARLAMRRGKTNETKIEKPPPRKVRRTTTKSKKQDPPEKPGNSLDRFITMPLDIFTEITSYLLPIDIISLSRSSKLFREVLMCRSSRHIWTNSMSNIEILPPCPSDMSELAYLALLFSEYCTGCGLVIVKHIHLELRMRLCAACRKTRLIALDKFPSQLKYLVHKERTYFKVVKTLRCVGPPPTYDTTTDVNEINERFKELRQAGDQKALDAWMVQRMKIVESRIREAKAIQHFLDTQRYLLKAQR
ncbi:unnamed protein product [Rhizoctonia solani]|uniref:F-box domain-containing protein n=1 Tax=Rhizoctonia solani TaxID=456999 RepID=A0A8H3DSR7_9AGAM|nr:unnamed protein product [Rhizoctonia solani]